MPNMDAPTNLLSEAGAVFDEHLQARFTARFRPTRESVRESVAATVRAQNSRDSWQSVGRAKFYWDSELQVMYRQTIRSSNIVVDVCVPHEFALHVAVSLELY